MIITINNINNYIDKSTITDNPPIIKISRTYNVIKYLRTSLNSGAGQFFTRHSRFPKKPSTSICPCPCDRSHFTSDHDDPTDES